MSQAAPKLRMSSMDDEERFQVPCKDQLLELLSLVRKLESREDPSATCEPHDWESILLLLLCRLKLKRQRANLEQTLTGRLVRLQFRLLLEALPFQEALFLKQQVDEEHLHTGMASLKSQIDGVLSMLEADERGRISYPEDIIHELAQAFLRHAQRVPDTVPPPAKQESRSLESTSLTALPVPNGQGSLPRRGVSHYR